MKQEILLDRRTSGLDFGPESIESLPNVGDSSVRRSLRGKLRRMQFEDASGFRQRSNVVAVEIDQIGNQPLERPRAQARDERATLGKRLQYAVELELAQRLAHVSAPNTKLRRELALGGEAIARFQSTGRKQVPDLPHDQIRWLLQLDGTQLRNEGERLRHRGRKLVNQRLAYQPWPMCQACEFAARLRLPAIYQFREGPEAGGLMSYGSNVPDLFRRAATFVAKILKGVKPGDLPIEQPTKFELVINLKAARALNLTIPQSLLVRAKEVIQ